MWTEKNVEAVSSQKICRDMCRKLGPSAPTRARKAANTPVVPPRPTERAIEKAKRSQPRKQYAELDLSNGRTTMQEVQASYRTAQGNRLSSLKPVQQPSKQQRAKAGAILESPLASSRFVQQPLKERSLDACTEYSSDSLPRTVASYRSSVPQMVTSVSCNSLRRDRKKMTVINVREPHYNVVHRTSLVNLTTTNHRKSPSGATSTPPPPSVKKPDPPKRPELPKSRLERGPMPLPMSKNPPAMQATLSLPLTSKQEYEYIDTEQRRVVCNLADTNAVHSTSLKSNSSGPGVYTALDQLTMDKRSEYAILNKEKPVSTESTPCEELYVTMSPVIPSEDKKGGNKMAIEEDEYVLPETSEDYENVPEDYENVPEVSSLQSSDSGIYAPLISSMMDECAGTGAAAPTMAGPFSAEVKT